ncbi:MAG TPA: hypothetical protein EYN54_09460 [Methylococcaceae bacterium]|nr:hypothetical protein [Methylococcaceae bacterium]
MSNGWIKLHRQILNWEWYDDINTSRLFIHLMLTANHKDNNWRGIKIVRGSRLTSLDKLSSETNLTVSKIRTSIKKLILTNEMTSKSHTQYTVFTMINYDLYQGGDKQIANESQTNDKRIATNKNDKNDNKNNLHQLIVEEYEKIFTGELPMISKLTDKRKSAINGCIKEMKGTKHDFGKIETWTRYFVYSSKSDWLMGRVKEWKMDFDFLIIKSKMLKIVEGAYDNK